MGCKNLTAEFFLFRKFALENQKHLANIIKFNYK